MRVVFNFHLTPTQRSVHEGGCVLSDGADTFFFCVGFAFFADILWCVARSISRCCRPQTSRSCMKTSFLLLRSESEAKGSDACDVYSLFLFGCFSSWFVHAP